MKKFLGVLGSILLVFGSIEFANSTVIGAEDYTKNWFFETAKAKEHSSNTLRRSNIKQKHTNGKKQNKNVASYATSNVVTNGNFTNGLSGWAINNPSRLPFGITAVDIDGPVDHSPHRMLFLLRQGDASVRVLSVLFKALN